jgi:hypothetical protein
MVDEKETPRHFTQKGVLKGEAAKAKEESPKSEEKVEEKPAFTEPDVDANDVTE